MFEFWYASYHLTTAIHQCFGLVALPLNGFGGRLLCSIAIGSWPLFDIIKTTLNT